MRRFTVLLGSSAALALLSTLAFADPAAPTATSQTDPNEIVCKTQPAPTGSRLGASRECHSQREWDQRAKDAQEATMRGEMSGMAVGSGFAGGAGGGH